VNLHHFLYEQALAKDAPPASDSKEWRAAVDYYRREMIAKDLRQHLGELNLALSRCNSDQSLKGSGVSTAVAATLEAAAPEYRAGLWKQHNQGNIAWIESVKPLLAKHGAALAKELARIYQTEWPSEPIRVDVSEYASWAGAYTTLRPTHITISSTDPGYRGPAALEMLFHEASHSLIDKLDDALAAELKKQNRLFKRRGFSHAVLFYTAGELTRRRIDGYTMYGIKNGVFENGWAESVPVLEKDWKPYIDGKIDLATAVRRLVEDYGVPRTP
jgi:hypothetical protein